MVPVKMRITPASLEEATMKLPSNTPDKSEIGDNNNKRKHAEIMEENNNNNSDTSSDLEKKKASHQTTTSTATTGNDMTKTQSIPAATSNTTLADANSLLQLPVSLSYISTQLEGIRNYFQKQAREDLVQYYSDASIPVTAMQTAIRETESKMKDGQKYVTLEYAKAICDLHSRIQVSQHVFIGNTVQRESITLQTVESLINCMKYQLGPELEALRSFAENTHYQNVRNVIAGIFLQQENARLIEENDLLRRQWRASQDLPSTTTTCITPIGQQQPPLNEDNDIKSTTQSDKE